GALLPVNEEAPLQLQLGNGWLLNEPSGAGRAADTAHLGLELAIGSMGGNQAGLNFFCSEAVAGLCGGKARMRPSCLSCFMLQSRTSPIGDMEMMASSRPY
ncbi:MAG TPA: hypothetical protein VF078_02555, partial [Nitrospira sp.]